MLDAGCDPRYGIRDTGFEIWDAVEKPLPPLLVLTQLYLITTSLLVKLKIPRSSQFGHKTQDIRLES